MEERIYIRRHWPTLSRLRGALRTEPNISMAVVFGSVARGDDTTGSDVDLLLVLRTPGLCQRVALVERLRKRTDLAVEVVALEGCPAPPVADGRDPARRTRVDRP